MLSPASLRVCCLAVMAPALTKADRQADCLPVVLSESFCISKTPNTYSNQNHIGEIRAYSSEYAQHKRRPFMQRACWRTQKNGPGVLNKYRSIGFDLSKSLQCSGKIRTARDVRLKSWQNINSTTAYAGKIKLKYTMNKNICNHKNMGLAKANTSLGLQSLKKMSQFSKENHNNGPNVIEDSLNFSDSVDSTVQVGPLISNIAVPAKHLDSNILPVNNKESHYTNDTGRKVIENSAVAITDEQFVLSNVCKAVSDLLLKETLPVSDNLKENHNASVILTDNLCNNIQNIESEKDSFEKVVSPIPCDLPNSKATDTVDANSDADEIQKLSATLESLTNESSFNILDQEESNLLSLSDSSSSLPLVPKEPSLNFKKLVNINLPEINRRHPFTSLFPALTCSKLLLNASKLSYNEERWKCPVATDCRFGLNYVVPVRKEKRICCLPSNQELESLGTALSDKSPRVKSVLSKSTALLRRQINAYVRKQIGGLVEHYQRKYQIPCQRQAKQVSSKSGKELVDLKAELLQSEDVKSMSTAALVNLVRKLETNGSPQSQVLSPKSSISNPVYGENACLEFEVDDYEDIKETSGIMLNHLKNMVKSTDPYFTDSSNEDYSEVEDEEETEQLIQNNSKNHTLFKYLTARASLASSSTWLLARNHELEYRIKEYDERLSELIKAEGKVCLEEPPVRLVSTENENVPATVKAAPKKILPLNGCFSTMDPLHVAKTTNNESMLSDLESSERTESDTEVEGTSCRTKPLDLSSFRKRKLTFIPGLHATNPKFSRLSSVHCYCKSEAELAPCILCTGQYNSIQSIDPHTMPLRDRIAILDPYFHPALSTENDISLCLQLENYLKIEAAKYCNISPTYTETSFDNEERHSVRPKFPHFGSSKLSEYARSLSEKYRNRHKKHYRKHKLVFGKWRRKNHRYSIRARTHRRRNRYMDVSSDESSLDSPVHSPMSIYDDGFDRKRKEEGQFDIDDVILPRNRSGRLEKLQYKDIAIPSWRCMDDEIVALDADDTDETENITESYIIKRHEILEAEEKERIKRAALGLNRRRRNRFDSRADSSGANTPDPTTLYNNQENVFGIPNFASVVEPFSPASPVTNPAVLSDDSQPPLQDEDQKPSYLKQSEEDIFNNHNSFEFTEVLPYEPHKFPLTEEVYEELLAEADHHRAVSESPPYSPDYASPESTSSTSTVEEDDDLSDPEWTVVRQPKSGLEQALVLKFAKR